jgi:phage pi2 protein 07
MFFYKEHVTTGYCDHCKGCAVIQAAKSFWRNLFALRTSTLESAEASYQTWYTNYLKSVAASGNGSHDIYVYANAAAQLYYEQTRNSDNYVKSYDSGSSLSSSNSALSSSDSQYQWQNRANWVFPNDETSHHDHKQQSYWTTLASRTSTWYGRPIYNGYYKNGAFVQAYGYYNSKGQYYSLQHDTIEWDDTLYGIMPDGWLGMDANTKSCHSNNAGSCYNQFDACLQLLEDHDYDSTPTTAPDDGSYHTQRQHPTLSDFLQCVEVDPMAQFTNGQNPFFPESNSTRLNFNCHEEDKACVKIQDYANQVYAFQQAKNANRRYYIGPHCASNSHDIGLAVYQDQYCSTVDSQWTVEQVLGYAPYSAALNLSSNECISCAPDKVSPFHILNASSVILSTVTNADRSFCTVR